MLETISKATASINLVDESFDPKKSGSYHLSILLNEKSLSYAVLDTNTNKYLVLHSTPPVPRSAKALREGEKGEGVLSPLQGLGVTTFHSVTCAIAHPKFTLVPNALFDEENKGSLLGFNHPVESDEKIHSDALQNLEARNLFTISKSLESEIRKQFVNVHFLHNATSFIEGLLIQNKNSKEKKVFANFHASYFEIVILDGRELLFSNAFTYKTSEEIAYYILFVYEQLNLNPEDIGLILSGEIEKTAKEHSLLYNYIRHVKFASLPDSFKYSYKFEEVPAHTFFSLFNQYMVTNN